MYKMKPCLRCGNEDFNGIPDSIASYCVKCGFVWVGFGEQVEAGATLQEWARDLAEAGDKKNASKHL